jgi:hypothetical protein
LVASISSFDINTRKVPTATNTIPAGSFQPGNSKLKCQGSPGLGCHSKLMIVLIAGANAKISGAM